ncbi:MAG: hypothetical protein JNL34_12370 [Anaerolineae bacterium]|nr:hypothetical protein [Anaerolineae bacterium]
MAWKPAVPACLLLLLALAGCSGAPATAVPTLTLIPPTSTPTSTPAGPTATPQPLTSPADLEATRPAATQAQEASPGLSLVDVDPVAADLAALAQRLLAEQLDLPVRRVEIVDVQAVVWPDTSLGCPQPDQMYAQVLVNGYRIVVKAAGEEVIFHTDFDRALRCPAGDEVLPPGVNLPEATPEAGS